MNKQTLVFCMIITLCLLLSIFCLILPIKLQDLEGNCDLKYNATKECPCIPTKFNKTNLNFSSLTDINVIRNNLSNFSIKLV